MIATGYFFSWFQTMGTSCDGDELFSPSRFALNRSPTKEFCSSRKSAQRYLPFRFIRYSFSVYSEQEAYQRRRACPLNCFGQL